MAKTCLLFLAVFLPILPLLAEDATVPGEVTSPYPTITNLSVEWRIRGDDNLNGRVTVRYRRVDEQSWHEAMPLRHVPAGDSGQR
ncbi:MAG: right-handed parallel beta-helix repeat-containing protein, partial [Pyrinomonadaceae bacterium]